jgi:neutral ceramidase
MQAADLEFGSAVQRGLARNRAMTPFLANPEAGRFQYEVETALWTDLCDVEASVSPEVSVFAIKDQGGVLRGLIGFCALHPTAMGMKTAVYSGDVFTLAAQRTEEVVAKSSGIRPMVMILNGAEGDVAAGPSDEDPRDRSLAFGIADRLSKALLSAASTAMSMGECDISHAVDRSDIASMTWLSESGGVARTAGHAVVGAPVIGGANDGITKDRGGKFQPGMKGGSLRDQAPKLQVLKGLLPSLGDETADFLTSLFLPPSRFPNHTQAGVHTIGPITLVTLPGEFTTILGDRIRRRVAQTASRARDKTMLVGLADGFVYYVTTEEEYNEQGYEGAATLYGPKSGEFFLQRYTALATPSSTPDHLDSSISYDPGPRKSFGLHTSYASEAVLQDGIAHLLVNASSGAPLIEPPRFKWWAPPLLWPPAPNTPVAWPSIEIEQESSPNV